MNFEESQNLYSNYQNNHRISKILALSSALVWTLDLASIYKRVGRVKKDLSLSDFYQNLSKKNKLLSETKFINTKEDYLIAYEKAEKFYLRKEYKKAENILKSIDNLNPSKEIVIKEEYPFSKSI